MSEYRRYYVKGGTYFFTVVTYRRFPVFDNPYSISLLNDTFSEIRSKHPFTINAIVILPDHLHTIWTLPSSEANFSMRWMLIKNRFTRLVKNQVGFNKKKIRYGRIWQNRFWDHLIRDEVDFNQHCNYIHYNPVKHGLVTSPAEWKYSSFGNYIQQGYYESDWGQNPESLIDMNLE